MALSKRPTQELVLMDGTKIEASPLKISLLKPFLKKFAEIAAVADDNSKSMDVLMECIQITMQQYNPKLADNKEDLEELLDLPTVYKIIEIASGIKMEDGSDLLSVAMQ